MRAVCVDTAEFLYPDITEYESARAEISVLAVRGSYACGQVMFTRVPGKTLSVETEGFSAELYEMVPVHVERNQNIDIWHLKPHFPERFAPYDIYDCIKPVRDGKLCVKNGTCALYFSVKIDEDAQPGIITGAIKADTVRIPVRIEISPVTVPGETLTMILCYERGNVCTYHGVKEGSPEFEELDTKYFKMLRRMRQNMLYCPTPCAIDLGNGNYDFDFSVPLDFMTKASSLGFRRFHFSLGERLSWNKSTILVNGLESMSFEAYRYVSQYLPRLTAFLREHGWLEGFTLGLCDEPNGANAAEYRALAALVRKFAPELRLQEAMSYGPWHGAVDIVIPLNAEYEKHREEFEIYRQNGDEVWYYDCCCPRFDGTINRFTDYALLATRYHFWAAYRYGITGYLHWAANNYMPGQDPFTESCPEHHNADSVSFLPAGDTHIMYPGDGEPWMSVRLEAMRASAEEYELLRLLAEKNKETADEICLSVCRSFQDVDYDTGHFRTAREKLIRALEKETIGG